MRDTYQKELMEAGYNAVNVMELHNSCDEIALRIIAEDEKLISVDKRFANYGSYRYDIWMNEYRFGKDFSRMVKQRAYKFADDEANFTVQDFREDIEEVCFEYAYQFF